MLNSETHYAGFWLRLWASVVDTVVVLIIILPILFAVYGENYLTLSNDQLGPVNTLLNWGFPAIGVILCWIWRSATPGKMVISAQIVCAKTGIKASIGQSIIRYIAYFISLIPFGLGFLWIAWDDKKQGWHDKIAGTVVIRDLADPKAAQKRLWGSVLIIVVIVILAWYFEGTRLSQAFVSQTDHSLQRYSNEGFSFGQGMPSNLCWQEMDWRIDHRCHDLQCKFGQVYFLKACLVASATETAPVGYVRSV